MFAQAACHRHAPGAKRIVRIEQLDAVEPDFGKGVESGEYQLAARALQHGARHVEGGAVFPVGQADPLQARFGRADIRIGNQAVGQQVGVHGARHRGRAPRHEVGMRRFTRVARQQVEAPAPVDDELVGWVGQGEACAKEKKQAGAQRAPAAAGRRDRVDPVVHGVILERRHPPRQSGGKGRYGLRTCSSGPYTPHGRRSCCCRSATWCRCPGTSATLPRWRSGPMRSGSAPA